MCREAMTPHRVIETQLRRPLGQMSDQSAHLIKETKKSQQLPPDLREEPSIHKGSSHLRKQRNPSSWPCGKLSCLQGRPPSQEPVFSSLKMHLSTLTGSPSCTSPAEGTLYSAEILSQKTWRESVVFHPFPENRNSAYSLCGRTRARGGLGAKSALQCRM